MIPTLRHGDRLLVLRHVPIKLLKRGHIVIGKFPQNDFVGENYAVQVVNYKMANPLYIKRLIGLPGDTLTTHITDVQKEFRSMLKDKHDENGIRKWVVPPKHFFVKSDSAGADSCIWGPLPFKSLVGVSLLKLPAVSKVSDKKHISNSFSDKFIL